MSARESIEDYIRLFANLRTDKNANTWPDHVRNRAPQKLILLLPVLDLFALSKIDSNFIEITEDLLDLFGKYWLEVLPFRRPSTLAMPFVRMESEGFWHLARRKEGESLFGRPERSVAQLQERVFGAYLDEVLYECLQVETNRKVLRSVLVAERYFSNEASKILLRQGFINREDLIYSEKLLEHPRDLEIGETLPLEEEYMPVRDQGFRRAVVTAYSHRCALCGIRVRTLEGHTAVTAAHIRPWSNTRDDRPVNGMALCRMCHWTFDEGLLGVSQVYEVIASGQLNILDNLPGYLSNLEGRGIVGPSQESFWPDVESLRWHRENVFRT